MTEQSIKFDSMLSATPLFRSAATFARVNIRRNFGASYALLKPAAAATDPIQKLFAEKVRRVLKNWLNRPYEIPRFVHV